MILCKKKNNSGPRERLKLRNEPYLIVNLALAGIVMMIFIYSGVFIPEKDNYPVVCIHEKITGNPCISCGLSHSFSLIIRGRISEALQWNVYGLRVFLFFALQLAMRFAYSVFYVAQRATRKELLILDVTGSVLLFLIAFGPFINSLFARS